MNCKVMKTVLVHISLILMLALPSVGLATDVSITSGNGTGPVAAPNLVGLSPLVFDLPAGPLVNDGSFESSPTDWTEWSTGGVSKILDPSTLLGISAYDGTYVFWAGGYVGGGPDPGYVEQAVAIPASALSLKFMANYYRPDADDPADPDFFTVSINGTQVFSKELLQAADTYPDWIKEVIDVSDYAGQTVTLRFEGLCGGTETGNVFIDFITVDATLEQPSAHAHMNGASYNDGTNICYIAEDFGFDESRRITALWFGGGTVNTTTNSLAEATALNFAIYADSGGVPDGDPSGGGNAPVWSLSLAPSDSQIGLTTSVTTGHLGDVTLTLATPVTLDAGGYWLVFYPTLNPGDQFYWHASDTSFGNSAVAISPNGTYSVPATWTSVDGPPLNAPFNAFAAAIETELASSSTPTPTPTPIPGGGGGGGGCFISAVIAD